MRRCTTSLELKITAASAGNEAGLSNAGYWGIPVRANTTYKGSFYAKVDGDLGPVTARLINNQTGAVAATTQVALSGSGWTRYEFTLKTGAVKTSANNNLELTVAKPGTLHLQLVSLFPPTYKNAPNGNRTDLMEKMAAMHPNFIRLPGGNYLEGDTLKDWYNWKETIGPLVDRPGHHGAVDVLVDGRVWADGVSEVDRGAACGADAGGVCGVRVARRACEAGQGPGAVCAERAG